MIRKKRIKTLLSMVLGYLQDKNDSHGVYLAQSLFALNLNRVAATNNLRSWDKKGYDGFLYLMNSIWIQNQIEYPIGKLIDAIESDLYDLCLYGDVVGEEGT